MVIQTVISVVKSTHLKPYSCKYSKKNCTQFQLLVLVLFKDFRKKQYREFIEDIRDVERIRKRLDLPIILRFTTLLKFLCQIISLYLRFFS